MTSTNISSIRPIRILSFTALALAAFLLLFTLPSLAQQSEIGHSLASPNDKTASRPIPIPMSAAHADTKTQTRLLDRYSELPLAFEANHGQTDARVKFLSRTGGYTLFLTESEAVLALHRADKKTTGEKINPVKAAGSTVISPSAPSQSRISGVLRMKLLNANPTAAITGLDELAGKNNYFIGGDPAKWHSNVPNYAKVKYEGIYSGIDLVYYGNQRRLEYDFIVAPGADPSRIAFDLRGARQIRRNPQGDLVIKMSPGEPEIRWHKPLVYQENDGARQLIAARYTITDSNRVIFQLAKYDIGRPLYIDPLIYSTYLEGGLRSDKNVHYRGGQASAVTVDSAGNAYVTGSVPYIIFPGTCPEPIKCTIFSVPFVAKINPTGTALIYSTFLGGDTEASGGNGSGIAVDSAGNAYVAGQTDSTDFPVTPGAFQTVCGGGNGCGFGNAFVAELNPTGSALMYATYLGGGADYVGDGATGIAIDSQGDAFVVGHASSDFPVTPGAYQTTCGNPSSYCRNAFVTEMNPTGTGLVYSTYLGGSGNDVGTGIALNSSGNAYVTGSTGAGFPTTPGAFQTTFGGNGNAFVTELNAAGSGLVYSTYLGGSAGDVGSAIAIDGSGDAYVTGITNSTNFPVTPGAFQTACGDCGDGFETGSAFVTMLNPTGSALTYSTYLGGSGEASGAGIALDSAGNAYVTGSAGDGFPTTSGAFQTTCCGAFVTKLNAAGTSLYYSTYLDYGAAAAIFVDNSGNAYVAGTASNGFPVTKGALQHNCGCGEVNNDNGYADAFTTKIDPLAATTTSLSSSPNPSTSGEAVTFTAIVTSAVGTPPDGESISFMKGTEVLGTGALSGGSASFTTSTLKLGTTLVKAVYSGDSNFDSSTSNAAKQVVDKAN